ncbi:protein of unknown function [Streptomyces sp. KY70]|nr:protein of unknown function [Streptomyces sp. KY70]
MGLDVPYVEPEDLLAERAAPLGGGQRLQEEAEDEEGRDQGPEQRAGGGVQQPDGDGLAGLLGRGDLPVDVVHRLGAQGDGHRTDDRAEHQVVDQPGGEPLAEPGGPGRRLGADELLEGVVGRRGLPGHDGLVRTRRRPGPGSGPGLREGGLLLLVGQGVGLLVQGPGRRLLLVLLLLLLLFGLGQLVDLLRPGRRTAAGARGQRRGYGGGGGDGRNLDRTLPRLLRGGRGGGGGAKHGKGLGGGGGRGCRESLRTLRRTGVRRYGVGARGAPRTAFGCAAPACGPTARIVTVPSVGGRAPPPPPPPRHRPASPAARRAWGPGRGACAGRPGPWRAPGPGRPTRSGGPARRRSRPDARSPPARRTRPRPPARPRNARHRRTRSCRPRARSPPRRRRSARSPPPALPVPAAARAGSYRAPRTRRSSTGRSRGWRGPGSSPHGGCRHRVPELARSSAGPVSLRGLRPFGAGRADGLNTRVHIYQTATYPRAGPPVWDHFRDGSKFF